MLWLSNLGPCTHLSYLCTYLSTQGANVFGAHRPRDRFGGEEGDDEGDDDDDDEESEGEEEEEEVTEGGDLGNGGGSGRTRRRRRRKGGGGGGMHQRHSSLEAMKLTAHSVAELKVFFEMFSQRHAEKQSKLTYIHTYLLFVV